MRFPLGIQSFEELRRGAYVYVDKTRLVYNLASEGKYYFLSRPRRFGKSLLISTLKAYFEGKKELFDGLAIGELETGWQTFPVLHLALTGEDYTVAGGLQTTLEVHLAEWEKKYGSSAAANTLSSRFRNVIINAAETTGKQVVVLVDEYDKPLLDNIENGELRRANKELLRGLYSNLKELDKYIRFALLTGVSKVSQVSIFSGLNNLTDISLNARYATLCGITERELRSTLSPAIDALAEVKGLTRDETCEQLKTAYDGYHFSAKAEGVYNPYSVIRAFYEGEFGNYWYQTGTPTFLAVAIRHFNYNLYDFANEVEFEGAKLMDIESEDPIPALYQSGYLTIKSYDAKADIYTLQVPNEEVRRGLASSLAPQFLATSDGRSRFDLISFRKELNTGNIEGFMKRLSSLFSDFDYRLIADAEVHFQNAVFLICTLLGYHSEAERCTCNGRMDYVLYAKGYIYIFEFKIDKSATEALAQIDDKGYALPFLSDSRKIIKVGVNFSTETRGLESYEIEG